MQCNKFKVTLILILSDIPIPPSVSVPDKIIKVLTGEDASFRVKITGTPEPITEWFVDGNLVVPNNRNVFTNEDQYVNFTLRKVTPTDENIYTIKVHNEYGDVEESVSLVIISTFSII